MAQFVRKSRVNPGRFFVNCEERECAADNSSDKIMLTESLSLARDILNYINRQVDEHEKEQRLFAIYNKLDARSYTLVNASKFKVTPPNGAFCITLIVGFSGDAIKFIRDQTVSSDLT